MRRLFSWTAYATATAAVLWMIFVVTSLIADTATSTRERGELREQVAAQQSEIADQSQAAQLLADQVTALGERPVISPERIIPSFPALIPGIPGLSGLPGLNGIDGRDGESIIGPQGESITGPQGVPGESIKGDPGDAGPRGETGDTGGDGKDGRSVTGVSCDADGRFVFAFSDDTTVAVGAAGMCATPAPAPAA